MALTKGLGFGRADLTMVAATPLAQVMEQSRHHQQFNFGCALGRRGGYRVLIF